MKIDLDDRVKLLSLISTFSLICVKSSTFNGSDHNFAFELPTRWWKVSTEWRWLAFVTTMREKLGSLNCATHSIDELSSRWLYRILASLSYSCTKSPSVLWNAQKWLFLSWLFKSLSRMMFSVMKCGISVISLLDSGMSKIFFDEGSDHFTTNILRFP